MKLTLTLIGRELVTVELLGAQPVAAPDQPTPEDTHATPEPPVRLPFGFHGGAGGSQERAW